MRDILRKLKNILTGTGETREDYYRKFRELIPELDMYKKEQISYFEEVAAEHNCASLKEYYDYVCSDPEELQRLRRHVTYSGTHFFRGEDWPFFSERCLSSFRDADSVSVWCAGCSSGEEVYTLLMAMTEYLPAEKIHILATDYNEDLLETCRKGLYFRTRMFEIPEHYQKDLILSGSRFTFPDEYKAAIRTEQQNLLTDAYPEGFDLILCRNVIKFFTFEMRESVQRKLAASLKQGGWLFLSHDDGNDDEMIGDPASMSLVQIENRSVYRRGDQAVRQS